MKKRFLITFALLLVLGFGVTVYAVDWTAELKTFMQSERSYLKCSIEDLNRRQSISTDGFKEAFDDRCVVVSGTASAGSVSGNRKEVTIYEYGLKAVIDTSDKNLYTKVGGIKDGDIVTVYGQLNVKGWNNDSYEIEADYIDINITDTVATGEYVYYGTGSMTTTVMDGLCSDGHIKFAVPKEWTDENVVSRLLNNNVNGYQFSLNALYPQNVNFPEIFYAFYFDYDFYLDTPPTAPTTGDRHDIENLIIKNIYNGFDADADDFKSFADRSYDYFVTNYHAADGKNYRLEFLFVPDGNDGIVCMLYLYYPKAGEFSHVRDVAYVIETIDGV